MPIDCYDELIKTAQALKTVKVDGTYWLTMYASVNSILMVASMLKTQQKEGETDDTIDNNG